MIQLDHVYFQYDEHSLFHFDIHIPKSERVVLIGPSGSGKSTCLNLIAGFLNPTKGTMTLNHQKVFEHTQDKEIALSPAQRPVSMLFQTNNLFDHLTVLENLALGINGRLKLNPEEHEKAQQMLTRVELNGFESRYPQELSGGQQQRVAIARTFLRTHPIILMDEPFSSLDEGLRHEMKELMNELILENQRTLVMVSHHPKEILDVIDTVYEMHNGTLIRQDK
ncbi:MAG: ATP-binding cassette domain-containing protein [Alcaligenaceae bacterium]|nr:ATP-binding cassette domain-containing protein [Alcaligenaceae bacterium]